MSDRKKLSQAEIERRLIADAENAAAWEPIGVVAPSRSPRPAWYGKSVRKAGGGEPRRSTRSNGEQGDAATHSRPSARVVQLPTKSPSREAAALRRKQLHDAIAELSEGQRHVIQLWLDGFRYSEIAHALGISVDAVKSRLRDARRHLRPNLQDDQDRNVTFANDRTGGARGR